MRTLKKNLRCVLMCAIVLTTAFACDKDEVVEKIPAESISLDKTELSMVEGSKATLAATIKPLDVTSKEVTWESSNDAIATVNEEGEVTAIKAGEATITVTTVEGDIKANCKVNVKAATISVESITMVEELTIKVGEESDLLVKVLPENATVKDFTITTTDDDIVFFAPGSSEIIGNKAGVVTITATTNDGNKTATCVVTVEEEAIPVESITVDSELTMLIGESKDITVSILPAEATNKKFTWVVADETIATINEDCTSVEGIAEGETELTLTTEDGAKTATCKVIVKKAEPVSTCVAPDGRVYKTVKIGEQEWMAENYAYLPNYYDPKDKNADEPRCYVAGYSDTKEEAIASDEYKTYGAFYNLKAAIEYCPKGWHLPTDEEWKELEKFLGMSQEDADKDGYGEYRGDIASKLKSTTGWTEGNGENTSGFNALPAGTHGYSSIFYTGGRASFLTSTINPDNATKVYYRLLDKKETGIQRNYDATEKSFCVRYVKDKE